MAEHIESVMITTEQIKEAVSRIAKQVTQDYQGKNLVLLVVLKGSLPIAADLMREIDLPMEIDFIRLSSYGNLTYSCGKVTMRDNYIPDVEGKDILVVEDIIDTGLTLSYLRDELNKRGAASVKICTLLNKEARREKPVEVDYVGFSIENEFVIGYGLDYNERYRNLPYIGILKLDD